MAYQIICIKLPIKNHITKYLGCYLRTIYICTMEMSVSEYANKRNIARTYVLRCLKNKRYELLKGVKSARMVGKTYVITIIKDYIF